MVHPSKLGNSHDGRETTMMHLDWSLRLVCGACLLLFCHSVSFSLICQWGICAHWSLLQAGTCMAEKDLHGMYRLAPPVSGLTT